MNIEKLMEPFEQEQARVQKKLNTDREKLIQQLACIKTFEDCANDLANFATELQYNFMNRQSSVFSKRSAEITAKQEKADQYLSCTVLPSAPLQSFDLSIQQLATHDQSEPVNPRNFFEFTTTFLGFQGSVTIENQTVQVTPNMSLKDIASALQTAGARGNFNAKIYRPQVANPLEGQHDQYQLVIQHNATGVPLEIFGDKDGAILIDLNIQQSDKQAEDLSAIFYINQVKHNRPTNDVSILFSDKEPVTFTLKSVTPNPKLAKDFLNVQIVPDQDLVKQSIQAFLGKVAEFVGCYNDFCKEDTSGNPDTTPLLKDTGKKLASLLIGMQGFFNTSGNIFAKDPNFLSTTLQKGNPASFGLNIFGASLTRHEKDSGFDFKWDEQQFNTVFDLDPSLTAVQKFWAFSFTSSNKEFFNMSGFPEKINSSLPNKTICVKAWNDGASRRAQFSLDGVNWTDATFQRGMITGANGTLYQGLTLYTGDYENQLGRDPQAATIYSFSFAEGNSQQYQENIGICSLRLNEQKLDVERKNLALSKQADAAIKRINTQKTNLQRVWKR